MTMSLSTGLISGMDTGSLVTQLIAAEGAPQAALRTRLKTAELAASAYRTVNTTFLAVRAAAETAVKPDVWSPVRATSSSGNVTVSASGGAAPGSLTFRVLSTASAHSVLEKNSAWISADTAYGATSIDLLDGAGMPRNPPVAIPLTDADNDGTVSLTEAAAAINASSHGLNAAVVQVGKTEFALQVTSRTTGQDSRFSIAGSGGTVTNPTLGTDASIRIGDTADAFEVSSATNTFDAVMPGATFTVKTAGSDAVTLTITSDPDSVAAKMQSLVDAVNASMNEVRRATSNAKGSTATLKGDFSVSQLSGRLSDAVTAAIVGGGTTRTDGTSPALSPATVGFELSKDGKTVVFNKGKFLEALKADPGLAQRMVAGREAGTDAGGNPVTAVTGLAQRLLDVANSASDSATGSLVKLAEGKESQFKNMQERIDAWDLRLAKRKETLSRQFTAMETSLSSLRNQSTWLAGQINSLPSG